MKTTKFNPFDYITDEQEIYLFLDDCFNDDDPQTFVNALAYLIDKKGVTEVSKLTGLNRESLYKTIKGDTKPTWDTMHRLIHALNLSATFHSSQTYSLQPT